MLSTIRAVVLCSNHQTCSIKRMPELPESFTNIHPAYLKNKTLSPLE